LRFPHKVRKSPCRPKAYKKGLFWYFENPLFYCLFNFGVSGLIAAAAWA